MPATVEAAVERLRAVPAPLQGALYMTAAALGFSVMNVAIRSAAEELDPLQIAFFRNFFALLFMLPWLWQVGAAGLRTAHLGLHLWRPGRSPRARGAGPGARSAGPRPRPARARAA